jgi:preprotein translocase subunit SecD
MVQLPQKPTSAQPVWVSTTPIATEQDLLSVSATWDCEAGLGPEDPAVRLRFSPPASERLASWTAANIGSMLAVVIDGEVRTFARVGAKLGATLAVCLSGAQLVEARTIAMALGGKTE